MEINGFMNLESCQTLDELWRVVESIHETHFPENRLKPILGNGKTSKPKFMFVFINPTARNSSSNPDWKGPRFPFIGTKPVWRIFHRAGLFDEELMKYIERHPRWSLEFTNNVKDFLISKSFYFTNIVKWTGNDAALPDSTKIRLFFPILRKEIELVKPKNIVTFGLIPFERLTGKKIKLGEYYEQSMVSKRISPFVLKIGKHPTLVFPCYFPVGRGNPKRAVELLRLLN